MTPGLSAAIDARLARRAILNCAAIAWCLVALPAVAQTAAPAGAEKPVILLTGFEPFKAGRPPNASWEGIARLQGTEWNGHRLVCEQMRVVWGMPLQQYNEWIAKYRPRMIVSFGEGGNGAFSLETRASNRRGRIPDNDGKLPPTPTIVGNAPAEFAATVDGAAIVRALEAKGHTIRASRNAGSYLCEEALFTLEHLKATALGDVPVLFCHVPPLGGSAGKNKITVDYLQRFVLDMLAAVQTAPAATSQGADAPAPPVAAAEALPDVRRFIEHYFSSWSNQQMDEYGACFHREASIQQVGRNGEVLTLAKDKFLAGQQQFHRTSNARAIEVPVSIDIRAAAKLVYVVVDWKLTAGNLQQRGFDHFTLVKQSEQWKIVNLVFYSSDE